MSDITAHGRAEVKGRMLEAEVRLLRAKEELVLCEQQYEKMIKANACPHDEIVNDGSFLYSQYHCAECDYSWMDS